MPARATITLPDCVKVCNCADCGRLLLGASMRGWHSAHENRRLLPPVVAGRVLGRPYCDDCLTAYAPGGGGRPAKPGPHRGEDDPGQQNALKNWENDE